jgi:hypothetical protein
MAERQMGPWTNFQEVSLRKVRSIPGQNANWVSWQNVRWTPGQSARWVSQKVISLMTRSQVHLLVKSQIGSVP